MRRYFFDLDDGGARDEEGTQLTDMRAVRAASVEMYGQALRDKSASFWDDPELKLTVRDDGDLILLRLTVFGTTAPAAP